jgi:predicted negative regulator of RcsB-dependent stress response
MNENLFEANYDVTKKTRFRKFYEKNKIVLFSILTILIIILISFNFYLEAKENKKILLSELYVEAKISLQNGESNKAKILLEKIIYEDNYPYSTLSLFQILNQNLEKDKNKVVSLFDHVLKNNKYDTEVKNLIIFKKALFQSNYINQNELKDLLKPLTESNSVWKGHALLLLGDFFFNKKEYLDAKSYYSLILSTKDLSPELYRFAKLQLSLITNE